MTHTLQHILMTSIKLIRETTSPTLSNNGVTEGTFSLQVETNHHRNPVTIPHSAHVFYKGTSSLPLRPKNFLPRIQPTIFIKTNTRTTLHKTLLLQAILADTRKAKPPSPSQRLRSPKEAIHSAPKMPSWFKSSAERNWEQAVEDFENKQGLALTQKLLDLWRRKIRVDQKTERLNRQGSATLKDVYERFKGLVDIDAEKEGVRRLIQLREDKVRSEERARLEQQFLPSDLQDEQRPRKADYEKRRK